MEEKKFRQILREHTNETKRHVSVVSESLLKELQAVAEQVSGNSENITAIKQKLEDHDQQFETIKTSLFFIKNELKQKVSQEEFTALEKRVNLIEAKLNRRE